MTGVLLVLALVGLIALSLWAIIDSALQPDVAYTETGISKSLLSGLLILTCAVGAVVYFLAVRPRLRRAVRRRP